MSGLPTPLADVYCARLAGDETVEDRAALEERLRDMCAEAERAWPDIDLPRAVFVEHLGDHLASAQSRSNGVDDAGTIADVYLACACGRGDPVALGYLEKHYLARIPAAVGHMRLPAATVDEVAQQVRAKLLLAEPGETPKIARYAAQGKLRGLIQLVAVRTAISFLRKHKRELPQAQEQLMALPDVADDPELGYLKARYRSEFRAAFAESVADLSARERNLLRLHLLKGVTLPALASMYSVHRATVIRWLAKARETLFAGTRRRMRKRLDVDNEEFESVMRLIHSRLDVSVQRLFATEAAAGDAPDKPDDPDAD